MDLIDMSSILERSAMMLAAAVFAVAAAGMAVDASAKPRASYFKLENGMEVVVIPDHRSPVVTHMVWYRVGGADEPRGTSGIAHFLEHLMFKGTDSIPPGEFSKIVARNGGQDNAFTSNDATAYFQRVAKDRLPLMMKMESDRMANLKLDPDDVRTERKVILEERRSRVDNDPASNLVEQMKATLYQSHP
ncbi:MAG: M16 family metallopeptidase [Hyphomicrobiales bacterium]